MRIEDPELVDNVLPEMFRGWEWYARVENKQSELNDLVELWSTLPVHRQLSTMKHLLEAIERLEPDRVPDFVADLKEVRLREVAETVLANLNEHESHHAP